MSSVCFGCNQRLSDEQCVDGQVLRCSNQCAARTDLIMQGLQQGWFAHCCVFQEGNMVYLRERFAIFVTPSLPTTLRENLSNLPQNQVLVVTVADGVFSYTPQDPQALASIIKV